MAYQSFENLEVWKLSCRLAVVVCKTVGESKHFALRDQMMRAVISIPSNIAEGYERDSDPDFIRFLRIAKGSAAELRPQCYIAIELALFPKEQLQFFIQECREVSAMLQGLIRARSKSET
ncbi:MAG: four helix bundle protein [Verrucomicrobia bacterium]|nr:four helix bundle protein [Pseudomonadota bacterium]NDA65938.1 four helix bundle protein [Verrucomicrobiota bacterium]NDB75182.1 four helix bundle protein [Verrucomicrobiota bacterium]NDD37795.1 four helix bundle protein [Verrucomicrobiota bacterium]NDE97584.1 four helix bundle protein [Verrucomicrobiota bacterium]